MGGRGGKNPDETMFVLSVVVAIGSLGLSVVALNSRRRAEGNEDKAAPRHPALRPRRPSAKRARLAKLRDVPSVSVVIPTLNEEASLPWVLRHLPSWVAEVVLVDGLSSDGTERLARRLRPDLVVVHQHQPGKGAALRAGFQAASGDVVVMIDADGSTDPREMHRFVSALRRGADFVKGSRHMEGGGSADFTPLRSAGNRVFVKMANLLYRSRFTDLCYGYCAFWRRDLDALALTADGFEIETELVLGAVKAGLTIREVPSFELERRAGTSNLNAARDGLRVLRTMLTQRLARRSAGARTAARFSLREVRVAAEHPDRLPAEGDRRSTDRRQGGLPASRYTGPERRRGERRAVQDTVVVQRVVYEPALPSDQDEPALAPDEGLEERSAA